MKIQLTDKEKRVLARDFDVAYEDMLERGELEYYRGTCRSVVSLQFSIGSLGLQGFRKRWTKEIRLAKRELGYKYAEAYATAKLLHAPRLLTGEIAKERV